jgi:hypothetical protein
LDNILIYSKITEEYIRHICLILERLRKYTLYTNLKKCKFYTDKVEFLSFVVSDEGVSIDQERVSTIKD